MASITAIELGANTCTLARVTVRRGEVHLSAADILDPAAFPGVDALTTAIRRARRTLRLPRRCRAIVWGLPDGASRKDAAVKPMLAPLTGAGFNVERVVSPCNALAALARLKTSRVDGSTCWVAINRGGVAIVVVRPGKLIYSHSFAWDSTVGAVGSQARLLQRYSLVAFLSPELKRAMAEAVKSGAPVGAVVTCGNLPELRALTMPLIEELDVEVETLDTLEGLVVKPPLADKLREMAPAIRVACAAAFARGTRPWDPSKKKSSSVSAGTYVRAAIAAAAIAGVGYLWYVKTRPVTPAAPTGTAAPVRPAGSGSLRTPMTAPTPKPAGTPPARSAASLPPARIVTVPTSSARVPPRPPDPGAPVGTMDRVPARPSPQPSQPAARKPGVPVVAPPSVAPRPPVPVTSRAAPPLNSPAVSADTPGAPGRVPSPKADSVPREGMAARLADPVPKVTAILVSRDRRFATVEGGQIIAIGDVLGRRTVVAIDERGVVLQEPSGVQIRVGLGGRVQRIGRGAR